MSSLQRRFGLPTDLTPSVCHSVLLIAHLLSFIRAMCSAHFHFVLVTYWTMSVTLVLCLMVVLRILSSSLTLSILLSIACWLVSSFFTNAFVRDHVWHPYVIAGKTHWLKTFLFKLIGRCLSRYTYVSVLSKNTPSCFYSDWNFLFRTVFHCYCLPQILIVSHLLYFCPVYLIVVCCVNVCHKFNRLVDLVVKASASRAGGPGFESR